ncbi:ABC transporter substrate-binding protein [uncultured Modestobacter sp.]|uniref:ABC transporter substrate-binding protein n=1 Tax=uncultured Modestobacter sp. TaxID=380048 RepID=UPI0026382C30|nr:ABC transporter substrate-binding protein [uncultured Modestobacter sp.]
MTLTAVRRMTLPLTAALSVGLLSACGLGSSPSTDGDAAAASSSVPAQSVDEEIAGQLPAAIADAGVIRMAINPAYPPFESTAADGVTLEGLDPDLAHAIGQVLGVEIEFVPTSFDAIIPSLTAGDVDMAMSSIGDTKEREEVIDFATYYWNGTLIMVPEGNPDDLAADQLCGAQVGVIRGSLQQSTFLPAQAQACTDEGAEPPVEQAYQDGPQAQLALQSGRIDAVMTDAPPLLDAESKNPDTFDTEGPLTRNPNPGGVAFPKGSELVEPVHAALGVLIENGTYEEILDRWNLADIAIEASEINGAVQ